MSTNTPLDRWFTPARFAALAAISIAACFLPVLLGNQSFFFRDYSIFSYPLAAYHKEVFWRGDLPLWNPYTNCGIPFMAQWNTMVFYPLSTIYLFLPLPWSLNFFCLFHFWLGGLGMYYLARAWTGNNFAGAIAGMAFLFNGVLLSCLKWPNNTAALGLMPWVVLMVNSAAKRGTRTFAAAALVGATQMMTGAAEIILLTWAFAGCWTVYRFASERPFQTRGLMIFALMVLAVAGLAAVQLAPFLELLQHSQRDETFASSNWPIPIWGWANFILPLYGMFESYHGVYAQPGQYWISTYYVSVVVWIAGIIAFTARRGPQWLLAAMLLFAMWMALGDEGKLYAWMKSTVPGVGMLRYPVKFVVLAAFVLPLLGAFGIARFQLPDCSKVPRACWIAGAAIALGVIGLLISQTKPSPTLTWNALLRVAIVVAALGTLAWFARDAARRHLAAGALLLLVILDGLTHSPWQNPTVPSWVYSGSAAEMSRKPILGEARAMISPEAAYKLDHLKFDVPTEDVMAARISLYKNLNLLDAIPKVDGFYSLYLQNSWDLQQALYGNTNASPRPVLDFLGVMQMNPPGSWSKWVSRTNAMPLISSPSAVRTEERPLQELMKSSFDPRKEALVATNTAAPRQLTRADISEISWNPESIRFRARSDGQALIVVAQTFYPLWSAFVGDRELPLIRVNHAFQGILYPGGDNVIRLVYRDRAYKFGAVISGVAATILVGMSLLGASRKR